MLSAKQKKEIIEFAETRYKSNDPYHTMKHIKHVVSYAVKLARIEKGNRDICWTAALLHDIMKDEKGNHGTLGAKKARKFLLSIGVDKKIADRVWEVIHFHNKGFVGGTIERQIVWDADKLDSFTLKNFKDRFIPSIMVRPKKPTIKDVRREYKLFLGRFHTKTGRLLSKKEEPAINKYLEKLEKEE